MPRNRFGAKTGPGAPIFPRAGAPGFTLLELLVACSVFMLLLVLLLSAIGQTSRLVGRSTQGITAFQEARAAFELMTRTLSQATLNTYWDYMNSTGEYRTPGNAGTFEPANYGRNSDLHFLLEDAGGTDMRGTAGTGQAVFFQLPSGRTADSHYKHLEQLLNACGFFIEYGDQAALPHPFPGGKAKYRFRLMQALQPSEDFEVFQTKSGSAWVEKLGPLASPVADNIVYALIWPRKSPSDDPTGKELTDLSSSGGFAFDSRPGGSGASPWPQPENVHQLPPVLQVTLVALDETTAARVCTSSTPPAGVTSLFSGLFETPDQAQFDADIKTLETRMGAAGFGFRIFTTTIPLKECKMQ